MRVLVLFDLPVLTSKERKEYRDFRKYLMKSGFLMMQESVYCKLVANSNAGETVVDNIRKHKPSDGLVQVIKITEKQYSKMDYIVGSKKTDVLDDCERLVFL